MFLRYIFELRSKMIFGEFAHHYLSSIHMREKMRILRTINLAHLCCGKINGGQKLMGLRYINNLCNLLIYLLTLFNVDYKTLAANALIKIDYPYTVFSNKRYTLNVNFTCSTWKLFTLPFSNFLFKNVEKRGIFSFSGTRFHI